MEKVRKIVLCLIALITTANAIVFPLVDIPFGSFTANSMIVVALLRKQLIPYLASILICALFWCATFTKGKWQTIFSILFVCYLILDICGLANNLIFLQEHGMSIATRISSLISDTI